MCGDPKKLVIVPKWFDGTMVDRHKLKSMAMASVQVEKAVFVK